MTITNGLTQTKKLTLWFQILPSLPGLAGAGKLRDQERDWRIRQCRRNRMRAARVRP